MIRQDLEKMDLATVRNLFLQEAKAYLIALEIETYEELQARRERLKKIDVVLEEKKKTLNRRDFDMA